MHKIKLRPVGLCYANGVDQHLGTSLYRSTLSLSKFEQLNWPELMLPIKLFQFKNMLCLNMFVFVDSVVSILFLSLSCLES